MTTLGSPVWVNGVWIISGPTPPDRSIPSNLAPPGNAPGSGFWAAWTLQPKTSGGKDVAASWGWVPLPSGNVAIVYGPNGPVPIAVLGNASLQTSTTSSSGTTYQLQDGPWPTLSTDASSGDTPIVSFPGGIPQDIAPANPPTNWSGGTWTKIKNGYWAYDNGQLSNSSLGTWLLVAGGVAAAGGAAFALK